MPVRSRRRTPKDPARRRGASAASHRAFEKEYRPVVEKMVAEAIEDRLDALDAAKALEEPGEIPHAEFWRKRGL